MCSLQTAAGSDDFSLNLIYHRVFIGIPITYEVLVVHYLLSLSIEYVDMD